MKVGSLFAGVGGFDLGFDAAGFNVAWQVEWDERCRSVLARHWPDVPRYGDVRDVNGGELAPVDCITYGFPCQDLSIAGTRAGLDGDRSGLFFEATRIIREMRKATDGRYPTWVVAENVAGLLNADDGLAMGRVLDELADLGAVGIEWATLDAQHFGVPQRRRRVFVVAWFDPRAVRRDPLFPVAQSCQGHLETGRQAGSDVAASSAGRAHAVSGGGLSDCAASLNAHGVRLDLDTETFVLVERERERESQRVDEFAGRPGRQRRAGWAPDRAAPLLAGEGRGYRNDVDGTTWVIE